MTTDTAEHTASMMLDELAGALAKFQAEMPVVPKTKTAKVRTRDGGDYSYTYADLADLTSAAMPILAKHGLAFTCLPGSAGLTGMLVHTSGQRLTAVLPINGASPQQVGSSLTYMRRYLLGCLTGLVTDDDDDGQAAENAPKRAERAPVAPPAPPRPRTPRPLADSPSAPPLATPEAPAPDGSVDVPLPGTEPAKPTPQVIKAFHAAWGELFPPDQSREDRLGILARIIGRPVESSKDMTRSETLQALGFLGAMREGRAGVVRRGGEWVAVSYQEPPGGDHG